MRTREKKVYYCDFCKKHGLARAAMEKHERTCTMNPGRECGWKFAGEDHADIPPIPGLVAQLRERGNPLASEDIDWLRDEVSQCPACMLAALRQSGLEYHYTSTGNLWTYDDELQQYRAAEREAYNEAEYDAMRAELSW